MCPGWIWFLLVFFPPAQLWEGFWRKDLELMWLPQSLELHSWAQHHPKGSQCSLKPWPGISSWICTKNGEKGGFFWHFGKVRLNRKMLPPRKNCFLKLLLNNHHTNPAQAELYPHPELDGDPQGSQNPTPQCPQGILFNICKLKTILSRAQPLPGNFHKEKTPFGKQKEHQEGERRGGVSRGLPKDKFPFLVVGSEAFPALPELRRGGWESQLIIDCGGRNVFVQVEQKSHFWEMP